jgi:hypothetical protein
VKHPLFLIPQSCSLDSLSNANISLLQYLFYAIDTRQSQTYIKTGTENYGSQQIAGLLIEISERDRIEVVGELVGKNNQRVYMYTYIYCGELRGLTDHNP